MTEIKVRRMVISDGYWANVTKLDGVGPGWCRILPGKRVAGMLPECQPLKWSIKELTGECV